MKVNNVKSIIFYSLLTVIIIYSIVGDRKAWNEKKVDLMNSLGPLPSAYTNVESFKIRDMNGNIIKSEQLNQENYLLFLWCIDQSSINKTVFDMLKDLLNNEKYKDFQIIPVNVGNKETDVKKYLADINYTKECYMDEGKTVKWAFNYFKKSNAYPPIFLIDNQGVIQLRQKVGIKTFNDNFLKRLQEYSVNKEF